jgi:hypothetical protein
MDLSNQVDDVGSTTIPQQQPYASLIGLPQELRDNIASHLVLESSKKDLLSLSYTCRNLRATCLPIIYREIDLTIDKDLQKDLPSRTEGLLLRSLSSMQANLGRHTKTLRLRELNPLDDIEEQFLKHTPNLTQFNCDYKPLYYSGEVRESINSYHLSHALRHVSRTLTSLNVSHTPHFVLPGFANPLPAHPKFDWKHLTALRVLSMPISALLGWRTEQPSELAEVLPPGLVHLILLKEIWWRMVPKREPEPFIRTLTRFIEAERWRESTPNLETINAHLYLWGSDKYEVLDSCSEAMRSLARANGLRYSDFENEPPEF